MATAAGPGSGACRSRRATRLEPTPSRRGCAARTFTGTTEEEFRRHLYAPDMHDPDMIIRTSGEQRLSNYLMWQSAYSELVFRDELWPDFDRAAFEASLAEYAARQRRFGRPLAT